MLLTFAIRHLLRHWRLHLVVVALLTLATTLLASLPDYAGIVAARSLRQTLESAPSAEVNLTLTAPPLRSSTLSSGLYGVIEDSLGTIVSARFEVNEATVWVDRRATLYANIPEEPGQPAATEPPTTTETLQLAVPLAVHLWSFERLQDHVAVVAGRLPVYVPPRQDNPFAPPELEVAIGSAAAGRSGLPIGTWLVSAGGVRVHIVGIVAPLDPRDDLWWGAAAPFDYTAPRSGDDNLSVVPLLTPPQSMREVFMNRITSWRLLIDREGITADNAQAIQESIANLAAQMRPHGVQITAGLSALLERYQARMTTARIALFLLSAQALVFILYTLGMMASSMLASSQGELATLAGRGGSRFQVTMVFALEFALLAFPTAALLGPLLAGWAAGLWARAAGIPAPSPSGLESAYLSLLAAGIGWLALVVAVRSGARGDLLGWQRQLARPLRRAGWQRAYVDLLLLALGGLVYWQLSESGSFLARGLQNTRFADPVLLLGPSLLLIAIALVFLRLFPAVLGLAAVALRWARGLTLSLGLTRMARDPLGPSRVVLLISLAAGLILFAQGFERSLAIRQEEMARYTAGADLRVSFDDDEQLAELAGLRGVQVVTPVLRTQVQGLDGTMVTLLAVDPETFERVARYPDGITNLTVPSLMGGLRQQTGADALPAIFSYPALPTGSPIGTRVSYRLMGEMFTMEATREIVNFPTLSGRFVVTSLPELEGVTDLATVLANSPHEAWLAVDPAHLAALADEPRLASRILDSAPARLATMRADALALGAAGAFDLNALVLAVLSVAGLALVSAFAARQRAYEFGILRAVGLSPWQLLTMLLMEGVLAMGMGLLAGTAIGYGLTRVMLPHLSPVLAPSIAGASLARVWIDWPALLQLYGLLAAFYALTLLILLLALLLGGLQRALRVSEE